MMTHIRKYISLLLSLLLVSVLAISSILPAYAINEPDTAPEIRAVYVYEFANGSVGVLVDYYLDYAVLPDEIATDSYFVVFVDTDGVTQLESVSPYTFVDSGYGRGLAWIPFTSVAADAYALDSAGIADYRVWLVGNPTLPWTATTATEVMSGAVADDGGVQTGETAESNSAAANDMTLLPAVPVVNDAYYFGGAYPFDLLTINIGTQGSGTWEITWEYWNGSAWTEVADIADGTTAFEAAVGNRDVSWTMPTDWNTVAVDGTTAYWVRARVSSYTAVVTQPLGTQSWVNYTTVPITVGTVDQWISSSVPETLASRVLYYAYILQTEWTIDMVDATADGDRLSTIGETYFTNVILGLQTLAPDCFSDVTSGPDYIGINYDTTFGATATSGTATVVGSPQTLAEGTDSIDTGVTVGTIIIDLAQWTSGTITDDTGTLTGSPVTLYPGVNTLTVTGAGTFTTDLEVIDTSTIYEDTVVGTGFDLTALATIFGMSRWMLSGLVWIVITIIACAAAYLGSRKSSITGENTGASKVVMILFAFLLVGGMLLGLLHPLVVAFVLIAYGALIGYVLFFRSETLHKGFMFMMWMFVVVSIAGNIAASGQSGITTTRLTADITDTETASITVASTAGFPDAGIIIIGDEQITYPDKDATHFLDTTFNAISRGSGGTAAVVHYANNSVRTKESAALNASVDYKVARITDTAGVVEYIALPARLLDLVLTFFKLPLEFLGTDLAILTYIWMVVAVGMILGFVLQLAGGRRV